jgi:ABC-type cobalamin transport system permease subunit
MSGFAIIILLALYFLPVIIAMARKQRNTASILVVNVFLGWTLIGWVVALAWSLTDNTKKQIED